LRAAERRKPKRRITVLRREYLVGDDPAGILRVVEPVPADAAVADGARLHLGAPARLPDPVVVRRAAAAAARHQRLTETVRRVVGDEAVLDGVHVHAHDGGIGEHGAQVAAEAAQLRVELPGDAVVVDEAAGAVELAAAASPRQQARQAPQRPRVVQQELAPAGLVHHLHANDSQQLILVQILAPMLEGRVNE
jgi:hypothetical protein